MAKLDDILRQKAERARPYAPRADWDRMAALLADDAAALAAAHTQRRRRAWWWLVATSLLLGVAWLGGRYSVQEAAPPKLHPDPIPPISATAPALLVPPSPPAGETAPTEGVPTPGGRNLAAPPAIVPIPQATTLPPTPEVGAERSVPSSPGLSPAAPVAITPLAGSTVRLITTATPSYPAALPPKAPRTPAWAVTLGMSSSWVPGQTFTGALNFSGLTLQLSRRLRPRWEAGISLETATFAYAGTPSSGDRAFALDNAANSPEPNAALSPAYVTRISGHAREASLYARYYLRARPQARWQPFLQAGTGYYALTSELRLVPVLSGTDAPYQLASQGGNLFRNFLGLPAASEQAPTAENADRTGQAHLHYASVYGGAGLALRLSPALSVQLQGTLHENITLRWKQSGYAFAARPGYPRFVRGGIGLRYTF